MPGFKNLQHAVEDDFGGVEDFLQLFRLGAEGDRLQRLGDVAGVFAFDFGVDQIAGL